MANITSVIPRLDDKTVLDIFTELQSLCTPQSMSLQAAGMDSMNLLASDDPSKGALAALQGSNSFLITRLNVSYHNFNVYYIRNQEPNRLSPFYDEIQISHNEGQGGLAQAQRIALIEHLNARVGLGNISRREEYAAKSIEDLQNIYHSTILKLETSFAGQIEKITSWTVEQTTALEKEKLNLAAQINAERERLTKEYEIKAETLKLEGEALDARKRELDDRAYMHARRGIHSDLRSTIKARQQKFTLTPETRRLRLPVHLALAALVLALTVANYVTFRAIGNLDIANATIPILAWTFGKQTAVTLALIATLFFYVRWMNRWFEQHAQAEFLLKQFELDIDRASWVVESAMEWRRDQQAEIPAPLLDGITRNLFSNSGEVAQGHSAADDLASALVGNASQLKLKMGENELNFDRKGLVRLGKAETA
jgi:hypothetical protein